MWTNITNSDSIIVFSNCRSALEAIKEEKMRLSQEINFLLFSIGALSKSCTLQLIQAHVDIEENEMADSLVNEARTLEPATSSIAVFDAKAVAKQKLGSNPRKRILVSEYFIFVKRIHPDHTE
ncbi:RNase H domain-containing protein [Trichonephila clavipes]|nr:RNase H domain-containing protein [Trichonephila clavipes]